MISLDCGCYFTRHSKTHNFRQREVYLQDMEHNQCSSQSLRRCPKAVEPIHRPARTPPASIRVADFSSVFRIELLENIRNLRPSARYHLGVQIDKLDQFYILSVYLRGLAVQHGIYHFL